VFSHLYSTKPWNADTGLYYYGYRYYHPRSGRWISRDPIAEHGGLNLFGFCSNNPVSKSDLLGLSDVRVSYGLATHMPENHFRYNLYDQRTFLGSHFIWDHEGRSGSKGWVEVTEPGLLKEMGGVRFVRLRIFQKHGGGRREYSDFKDDFITHFRKNYGKYRGEEVSLLKQINKARKAESEGLGIKIYDSPEMMRVAQVLNDVHPFGWANNLANGSKFYIGESVDVFDVAIDPVASFAGPVVKGAAIGLGVASVAVSVRAGRPALHGAIGMQKDMIGFMRIADKHAGGDEVLNYGRHFGLKEGNWAFKGTEEAWIKQLDEYVDFVGKNTDTVYVNIATRHVDSKKGLLKFLDDFYEAGRASEGLESVTAYEYARLIDVHEKLDDFRFVFDDEIYTFSQIEKLAK